MYVGFIICLFLTIINTFNRTKKTRKIKNILLIKFWGIGSITLLTPMIRALKNNYKDARITILTLKQNIGICESIKDIDEVMFINTNNIFYFFCSTIKTIFNIKVINYDLAIDLEIYTRFSSIMCYLSNSPIKIGF